MNPGFRIDLKWVEARGARSLESHFLAEIGIEAAGATLTSNSSIQGGRKRLRTRIRVSAYHLAAWFVANWWRLRWESEGGGLSWEMSHRMGAVGNGYLWPDIEIRGGHDAVRILATPFLAEPVSQLRFLYDLDRSVPAAEFEDAVKGLVASVAARLSDPILDCPDDLRELSTAWKELEREMEDPDATLLRSLEARMGFDPEEADSALLDGLKEAAREVGNGAIEEMAIASKDSALEDLCALLETIPTGGTPLALSASESLSEAAADSERTQARPWRRGVDLARAARREWQAGDGGLGNERLAEICGVQRKWIREGADGTCPMSAGIRGSSRSSELMVSLNRRHPTSRRFALARIIGDHIKAKETERLLPITESHTPRQQFQRAFATEFLCPVESLKDFVGNRPPDADLVVEAASRYEVSTMLIERAMINNELLPQGAWPV